MSAKTYEYRKRTIVLLFVLLLARFWLGQTFELTPGEAYTWAKGRELDWSYWDQGALTPWLCRLGTIFFGQTELGVRWLASVIFTGIGFVLFYTVRDWFGARTAFWTVVLLAILPIFSAPLLLLSDATVSSGLMALALLIYREMIRRPSASAWAAGGLLTALALMTSWWNLTWIFGLLFLTRTRWRHKMNGEDQEEFVFNKSHSPVPFHSWYRWVFLGTTAVGFIPLLLWARRPEVAGLRFFQPWNVHQQPFHLGTFFHLLGDLLIGLTPFILILMLVGQSAARSLARRESRWWFFLWMTGPGLVALFLGSFWSLTPREMLPVFILPLLPLIATIILFCWDHRRRARPFLVGLLLFALIQSAFVLIPRTSRWVWPEGFYPRQHYRALAEEIVRTEQSSGATFVLADDPLTASGLSFYLPHQRFVFVARRQGVRSQYDFWSGYEDFVRASAILVTNDLSPSEQLRREFQQVEAVPDPLPPDLEEIGWRLFVARRFGGEAEPFVEESMTPEPLPKKK
jgi:4-amino-4-deoxy-L-arabinose transferase-like glycosyltransferase